MSKPTVAILGASADRAKFGNKSVRAHAQAGYEVYPVNPSGGEIEGLERPGEEAPRPVGGESWCYAAIVSCASQRRWPFASVRDTFDPAGRT